MGVDFRRDLLFHRAQLLGRLLRSRQMHRHGCRQARYCLHRPAHRLFQK
jgi:hypothetical protein